MARNSRINRMLISVKVLESTGPIMLLVNEGDLVADVIRSVIKEYTHQRRLPVVGKDPMNFDLWCASVDGALGHRQAIGSTGSRNFWMCKNDVDGEFRRNRNSPMGKKDLNRRGGLKSLISKSINLIRDI